MILLFGALLGLTSVMVGALVDHSLAASFNAQQLQSMATAIRYHQLYAILVSVLGLAQLLDKNHMMQSCFYNISTFLFIAGSCCFCGGIYLALIANLKPLIFLTPIGGIVLMLAWLALSIFALRQIRIVR